MDGPVTVKKLLGALGVSLLLLIGAAGPALAADVTVFGAASLSDALKQAAADYQNKTGKTVAVSLAASSALARQIEASGGADIFISADQDWMDYLAKRNLIQKDSREDLLGNRLVLIAPKTSHVKLDVGPHFDLLGRSKAGGSPSPIPDRCRRANMAAPR